MTSTNAAPARIRARQGRNKQGRGKQGRGNDSAPATRGTAIVVAVALALLGGVAVASAPWMAVVQVSAQAGAGAQEAQLSALLPAALWSSVFAGLIPALAACALVRQAVAPAAALLAGNGAIAVGLAVTDIQLWSRALDANRFELFFPDSAVVLDAAGGAYAVAGGHIVTVLAGLAGLVALQRESLADGYGSARSADRVGTATASRIGTVLTSLSLLAVVGIVAALFAPTYRSTDPVIVAVATIAADGAMVAGAAILAVALLVVAAASLSSISPHVACAAMVGAALALLGVSGAQLIGGLSAGDRIAPAAGAVWGVVFAAALVACALAIPAVDRFRDERALDERWPSDAGQADRAPKSPSKQLRQGGKSRQKREAAAALRAAEEAAHRRSARWHLAAGLCALLTSALAGLAVLLPVLVVDDGLPSVQILAVRVVVVAAAVLALAAVWLLLSEFAAIVRPVVAMLWVGIPLTVSAVTQPVLLAAEVPGVHLGPGMFAAVMAVLGACVTGVLVWFAGAAERDDVDTSTVTAPNRPMTIIGGALALALVLGYAFPLLSGTTGEYSGNTRTTAEYSSTSFAGLPWDIDAWGQLLAAAATVISVVVALYSRPARAAALFAGCGLLAAVYLSAVPLTRGIVDHIEMGLGVYATAIGIVLSVVATALAARVNTRTTDPAH
ncbi:MAG: hypothetical protein GX542_08575 [Rhodococcus sp.]|nr:hypothetical protein [Rhodococcus sp. (in: high G+C Gram-positive bacteria)]